MIVTAAVLMFGAVASAQTVPNQSTPPKPNEPVRTDVPENDQRKVQPAPQGVQSEQPIPTKTEQPAADRAKANEHVKSVPDSKQQQDTTATTTRRKNRRP